MDKLREFFVWQFMLQKRLFYKKSFLVILCMIPVFAFCVKQIASQDSGILTIGLCAEEASDPLSSKIIRDLLEQDGLMRYVVLETTETAYEAVRAGKVDGVWIFKADMQEKLNEYTRDGGRKKAFIDVVVIEDNVAMQLARTELWGKLYPYFAYSMYRNYIKDNVMQGAAVSEEELLANFERGSINGILFDVVYLKDQFATGLDSEDIGLQELRGENAHMNYLMIPVRGFLLLFILLCGLACAMYYLQDQSKQLFAWIPLKKKWWFLCQYLLPGIVDATLVVAGTGFFLGIFTEGAREAFCLVLYVFMAVVFCNLVCLLCRTNGGLGKGVPLLLIIMLVICPIFVDWGDGWLLQYLFPPSYYIRALQDGRFLLYMGVYILGVYLSGTGLYRLMVKKSLI